MLYTFGYDDVVAEVNAGSLDDIRFYSEKSLSLGVVCQRFATAVCVRAAAQSSEAWTPRMPPLPQSTQPLLSLVSAVVGGESLSSMLLAPPFARRPHVVVAEPIGSRRC